MVLFTIINYHCWARKWLTIHMLCLFPCRNLQQGLKSACCAQSEAMFPREQLKLVALFKRTTGVAVLCMQARLVTLLTYHWSMVTVHHCIVFFFWLVVFSVLCHASSESVAVEQCFYILTAWPSNLNALGTAVETKLSHSLSNLWRRSPCLTCMNVVVITRWLHLKLCNHWTEI